MTINDDLIERLDSMLERPQNHSASGLLSLLRECRSALSPVLPDDVQTTLQRIREFANDEIAEYGESYAAHWADLIERLAQENETKNRLIDADTEYQGKLETRIKELESPVLPADVQGKIQRYKDMAETGHVAQAFDGALTLIERQYNEIAACRSEQEIGYEHARQLQARIDELERSEKNCKLAVVIAKERIDQLENLCVDYGRAEKKYKTRIEELESPALLPEYMQKACDNLRAMRHMKVYADLIERLARDLALTQDALDAAARDDQAHRNVCKDLQARIEELTDELARWREVDKVQAGLSDE